MDRQTAGTGQLQIESAQVAAQEGSRFGATQQEGHGSGRIGRGRRGRHREDAHVHRQADTDVRFPAAHRLPQPEIGRQSRREAHGQVPVASQSSSGVRSHPGRTQSWVNHSTIHSILT